METILALAMLFNDTVTTLIIGLPNINNRIGNGRFTVVSVNHTRNIKMLSWLVSRGNHASKGSIGYVVRTLNIAGGKAISFFRGIGWIEAE